MSFLILPTQRPGKKQGQGLTGWYYIALNEIDKRTIKIVGQEYNSADYIFKNNISEINPKYNDKYDIPESFVKIEEYIVDGILLYEVYKSKEK